MIDALKTYLEAAGYTSVTIDFMPDEKLMPEVIYLCVYNHDLGALHDGSSDRYIQIQVRRRVADNARNTCNDILALLDSGWNEDQIHLTSDVWCIGRPTRGATIITRGNDTATYYGEVALWGET